jgi:hypothetical protein
MVIWHVFCLLAMIDAWIRALVVPLFLSWLPKALLVLPYIEVEADTFKLLLLR